MIEDAQVYLGVGGAFAVVALVEVIKRTLVPPDSLWSRVVPGLSILVGIAWQVLVLRLVAAPDQRWEMVLFLGIAAGLSASGLWSGGKATVEGVQRFIGNVPPRG